VDTLTGRNVFNPKENRPLDTNYLSNDVKIRVEIEDDKDE